MNAPLFTQEDLDRIVRERLSRDRQKRAGNQAILDALEELQNDIHDLQDDIAAMQCNNRKATP